MTNLLEKEQQLDRYVKEWISARYDDLMLFYKDTSKYRRSSSGIYKLKEGEALMDLLNDIVGNLEEKLLLDDNQSLIPSSFSSISQFLLFVCALDDHLRSKRPLLERNICGEYTSDIVFNMLKILDDIHYMRDRCWSIYREGQQIPIPYQALISALEENNLEKFRELMECVIKDVPYLIRKETINEGYFHTLFHVITSILGFKPISEKVTNDGRIDMRIELQTRIFIMEFKYTPGRRNLSRSAFNQILKKGYADSDKLGNKPVIGVGISFSKLIRNINGIYPDVLYQPAYSPLA